MKNITEKLIENLKEKIDFDKLKETIELDALKNYAENMFQNCAFWEYKLLQFPLFIILMLIVVAFYTLAERKIMASMQRRVGPNVTGIWGILQPFADGLKLLLKEIIIPRRSIKFLFVIAPYFTFALSLTGWCLMPFSSAGSIVDVSLSMLVIFAISSLGVYGIIIAGWSSNSRYAFLGALRSAAQMISYEVSIGFIFLSVVVVSGSFNLSDVVFGQYNACWYIMPLFPQFVLFLICMFAETNRAPFDLPEAEAELVAGYNVEYSSITFAMFFLAEYLNMLLMSALCVIFFFGGWTMPGLPFNSFFSEFFFSFKIGIFGYVFVWVRATFPRYRYDQLMTIGWKIILPLTFASFIFTCSVMFYFDAFVPNSPVETVFYDLWEKINRYF